MIKKRINGEKIQPVNNWNNNSASKLSLVKFLDHIPPGPSRDLQAPASSRTSLNFQTFRTSWTFIKFSLLFYLHRSQDQSSFDRVFLFFSVLFQKACEAKLESAYLVNVHFYKFILMPSPSASSKFVLSVLKFLGMLKFLRYTQNILGILK